MKYFKLLIYTLGSLVFLSSCNLGNPPKQDHITPSFGADIHSFSSQGNLKAPNVPFPLSMRYSFIKTLVNNRQQVYSPVTDGHWPAGLGSSNTTPLSVFLSDDLIKYIRQLKLNVEGEVYTPFSKLTDAKMRTTLQEFLESMYNTFHIKYVNDQAAANIVIGMSDLSFASNFTSFSLPPYGGLIEPMALVSLIIDILHLNTDGGNNCQAGVLFNSTSSSYSLGSRIQLYVDQVSPQFARDYRYTSILIARYIMLSIMESIGLSPYIDNNQTLHPPSALTVPYQNLSSPTIVQPPNDIHDMFNYIRDNLIEANPLTLLKSNLLSINQTDMNSIRRLLRWPELNNRSSILHFAPGSSSNNTLMGVCFSSSSSSNTSLNHGVKGDMDGSICFETNISGLKYTASDLKGNASFQYPLLDLAEANPQDITTEISEIRTDEGKYERVWFSIKPKPQVRSDFFGTILFQDSKFPQHLYTIYTGTDGHFKMSKFGPYKVSCSFAPGEVPNFDKLDCSIKYNDEEVGSFEGTINGTSINFPVTTSPDKINFNKPVSSLSKIKDSENIMIYPTGSDTFALIIGGSDPIGFKGTLGSVHSGKGCFSPPSS